MNPATLRVALKGLQALRSKQQERKELREIFDYQQLAEIARSAGDFDLDTVSSIVDAKASHPGAKHSAELLSRTRSALTTPAPAAMGDVSRAARKRLEDAWDDLRSGAEDIISNVDDPKRRKKAAKKVAKGVEKAQKKSAENLESWRKSAAKATDSASKKLDKKLADVTASLPKTKEAKRKEARRRTGIGTAVSLGVLAAVAGGAYYFISRHGSELPGTTPPRTDDFKPAEHAEPTEAQLVWTSETPATGPTVGSAAGPLAEEPAVRDEALLSDLDEQLAKHNASDEAPAEATAEAPADEQTPDPLSAEEAAAAFEAAEEASADDEVSPLEQSELEDAALTAEEERAEEAAEDVIEASESAEEASTDADSDTEGPKHALDEGRHTLHSFNGEPLKGKDEA